MKELSILDLRFGFYVKNYPYGQSPRSKFANPAQHMRKSISQTKFVFSGSSGYFSWSLIELVPTCTQMLMVVKLLIDTLFLSY